ncbi:MAG: PEP-utilizing enzyme, partial [Candidatus Hodarchaeota archaeon]
EKNIEKFLISNSKLNFTNTILSDMAFWNPSELIGDNPNPLDYSIFREIFTKNSWNKGLSRIGYSKIDCELMEKYGNKPYINLNYAFYSLIPENINDKLKLKLIDFYKNKLKNNLSSHDKIEFEIVFSCYDFNTSQRLYELIDYGFSEDEVGEISNELIKLTLSILTNYKKLFETDKKSLGKLESIRLKTIKKLTNCSDPYKYLESFLDLLNKLNEYGTPQFATMARNAFIAKALLKSILDTKYIDQNEYDYFMQNISTIAHEFDNDFKKYIANQMSKSIFDTKYGHLRWGTYDIRAKRYDQISFSKDYCSDKIIENENDNITIKLDKLETILNNSIFSKIPLSEFLHFIQSSIKEREYFKYEFTNSLSTAIELLAEAGKILGFDRDQLSYLDIPSIKSYVFYNSKYELISFLESSIKNSKEQYHKNLTITLPAIIQNKNDFRIIKHEIQRPNFITQKTTEGDLIHLENDHTINISDKILVISKADPGFDWIFTKNIKGLITKYGGAGSHMAIRCAEFNIPAAIGCGEQIFKMLLNCSSIKLDCKRNKIIKIY